MRLAEELILLLLNEDSGYLEQIPSWNLSCVFAGAIPGRPRTRETA